MKIRFTGATGCPWGQFVVEAENEADRAILRCFMTPAITADAPGWQFVNHGSTWNCDHADGNPTAFNFGWRRSDNGS